MTGLSSALSSINYYVVENESSTKTGLPTSKIYSREYGVISGVGYEDSTTFNNLNNISSSNKIDSFQGVRASDFSTQEIIGSSVNNLTTSNRVSSLTSASFNGAQLNSEPDLFNSAQNLAASVAQTFNNSSDVITSSNNSGVLNFQNSLDSVASSLTNGISRSSIGDKIKSDLSLLFPGIIIPGLASILDNSDAALRAQQAAEISLPSNVADGILTKVAGLEVADDQDGEILTAAQQRLASITETSLIQNVGAGSLTSSSQLLNNFAQNITAAGADVNLPGTDASLSNVNSALGGSALAEKVKTVESQLNAATQNALYSTNNIADKATQFATSLAQDKIVVAFQPTFNEISNSVNGFLVQNVPFVGTLTGSLTQTTQQQLGLLGLAFGANYNIIATLAGQALTSITGSIAQRVGSQVLAEQLTSVGIGALGLI